jgi:hypothetical protein
MSRGFAVAELARVQTRDHRLPNSCEFSYSITLLLTQMADA